MGVSQGSILDALVYSIYTPAIEKIIQYCVWHMYTDDLQIYTTFDRKSEIVMNQKLNFNAPVDNICGNSYFKLKNM